MRGWGRTQAYRAQQYLRFLKHLTLIELAIRQESRNDVLWACIRQQVGDELLEILRNKSKQRLLRKPMVKHLERMVNKNFAQLRRELKAADLPSLLAPPQNHV